MARVPYLSEGDLQPADRPLLARPINIFRALAHSPGGLRAWTDLGDWIRYGSSLDARLRELAILQVALTAGNEYVFSHHVKIGLEFGVTSEDVAMVTAWPANSTQECTELEHAVLAAVGQITEQGTIDEDVWRALAVLLPRAERVDLLLTAGYYNMGVRCAAGLEVEVEPEYQQYLSSRFRKAEPGPSSPATSPIPRTEELAKMLSAPPNWGRWGSDDQKGTINLVTADKTRDAARLVRTGRTVTLSRPFPTEPGPSNPRPATRTLMRERKPQGGGAALEYLGVSYHGVSCTHVDALSHNWGAAGMWGGRDPEEMLTPDGSLWGDIEQWRDGVVTRGVLLDIPRVRGVPFVEMDQPVYGWELDAAAQRQQAAVVAGDAVVVYCGRDRWDETRPAWGSKRTRPGLHPSCLQFLKEHDVAVLAWDMMDALPVADGLPWSVHGAVYALGLALVDNCELGELAVVCDQQGRYEFMFTVAPLRLARGTGSPVNSALVSGGKGSAARR